MNQDQYYISVKSRKYLTGYFLFLITFLLLVLEVLLRIQGIGATRTETIRQGYHTYYGKKLNSWYWHSTPNTTYIENNFDFAYQVTTNSLGHREREPEEVFTGSVVRIIALGDSFTEGSGTVPDSTYVRHLEGMLSQRLPGSQIAFYNAGTSGSDPFFTYVLLRDRLLNYHPQVVIQTVNASDYIDFVLRGGFERFKSDSTCAFRKPPWFEPLYHYSYVFRIILHLSGYPGDVLMKRSDFLRQGETIINPQLVAVADSFSALAAKNGFRMLFVLHPGYGDYMNSEMSRLQQNLAASLRLKGYCVANLWQPMNAIIQRDSLYLYGYRHDLHFTGKGYRLMAEEILQETDKHCPGLWQQAATIDY